MKIQAHNARAYVAHLEALEAMRGGQAVTFGSTEYRELQRIEAKAHKFAEKCCNEDIPEEQQDKFADRIRKDVSALFGGKLPEGFKMNWDPRGYALKIDNPPAGFYRDWGGYGILAPEF